MRTQCHQHLMYYENTQQNTRVGVHGADVRVHTRTLNHTLTSI